jgi:NADH:ubiquinone oxidoreductase subunit 4 (subunit M)
VLFYLFFEGGLIPMFLIIGIWGHARRVYASFRFFLYTFAASLLMLLAMMAMYGVAGTTDIVALPQTHSSIFPGGAILPPKVPIFRAKLLVSRPADI